MTDPNHGPDGDQVLTLQQLIRARLDERGWTLGELERRSSGRLTKGRWQQLGAGARMTTFPEPATLQLIADVLEVDVTTVVLAAAQTVGLDARRRGPDLAHLLPAGTDRLSPTMRDAILTLIRASVAETLAGDEADDDPDIPPQANGEAPLTLEWPRSGTPLGRNTRGRSADRKG